MQSTPLESMRSSLDFTDLMREVSQHIIPEKREEFVLTFLDRFADQVHECSNGGWQEIGPLLKKRRAEAELNMRRTTLNEADLLWLAENGSHGELPILRRLSSSSDTPRGIFLTMTQRTFVYTLLSIYFTP